ncbi:MAG TPA: tetratricopeptide repeat protein, partial [Anaerolineales bacterium]|nr:tetratricopeptide repeat protein [Anaerolineales bacterium]
EDAASLAPDEAFPWNELGRLFSQSGRHEQAIAAFQKAIENDPKDAISWNGLGDVYHQQGRTEDAIAAYQLGNVFDKQNRKKGAAAKSEPPADPAESDPQVWLEIGNIHLESGETDAALSAYQKAIELEPDAAGKALLWDRLGKIYQRLGQDEQAAEAFHQAIELDPVSPDPKNHLADAGPAPAPAEAELHEEVVGSETAPEDPNLSGTLPEESADAEPQPAEAVEAIKVEDSQASGQESFPETLPGQAEPVGSYWIFESPDPVDEAGGHLKADDPDMQVEASVPLPLGQFPDQALLDHHKHAEADPESPVMVFESAIDTLDETSLKDVQPALQSEPDAATSSTILPVFTAGSPNPGHDQADYRVLENDIAAYRRVTELNPKNDRAWDALGNMYEAVGLHSEAIAAFEQAIALDPRKEVYYYHLGLAHASQTHYEKAIQALKMVVELNPDYMLAHCALAGYYRRIGKESQAQKHIAIARPSIENENEYNQACFESISGNADRAIAFLKIALEKQQIQIDWVRSDPDLDFIRTDPRFEALVHKSVPGSH